jgi:AraC-like DNA-binding protein
LSADASAPATHGEVVFVAYLRSLIDYLRERGFDTAPLLVSVGLDERALDEPDRTIPAARYLKLWQQAEHLTGDAQLGLHVGEQIRPGKYGVLGYVMMSCETLGESLLRQLRYQDLVGKSGRSELLRSAARCELRWLAEMSRSSRHIAEEHVASWVAFARWILGAPGRDPLEVWFEHPAPAVLDEHEKLFRCTLRFGQPHTAVVFSAELLDLPLRDKNPDMRRLMDRHAETLLAQHVQGEPEITREIRAAIAQQLADGVPPIERVAAQLQISPRTLQRRLASVHSNYKDLVDDVRRRLALRHVDNRQLSLPEIAFLLGFSEQSSFQRAFKRWTGLPPGRYRESGPR